eukprot:TRINITY_DN35_c1_g1_i1.p2 TRINITY_DN35_c1_g1~~TRINITY_DN35_c1_g1_i1.p2  ORF type:complete len:737 (+),score=271.81 TRINITY_DN35_c1_g1_i1:103-2211(+)
MAMKGTVHYEKRQSASGRTVAVLTMDNPPMNPLSSGVRSGLHTHCQTALADPSVHAIVVTGARNAFCAGADISEFSGGMKGPGLLDVIKSLEDSQKPVVAAVDGVSLGGGMEVALGCHFRVASERAMAGLPEVNLGLLPGAGGTQRTPRLIGAERAIDFMCSGAPLPAKRAVQAGVYDTLVPGDKAAHLAAAIEFAASKVGTDLSDRRLAVRKAPPPPPGIFEKKARQWGAARKGENAPQAIIRCIAAACDGSDFATGMKVEQKEFGKLMPSDQSKALRYMFFAERECAKIPGLKAQPGPLNEVGIIGAGLMGGGIAMCCAEAGMRVYLLDVSREAAEKGVALIKKNYARSVQRKSKSQAQVDRFLSLITPTTDYQSFAQADIVVEAVFENMKVKKQIFEQLDSVCKQGCILASNTSGLSIDEIASATKRPQDVIGCHFFSPANVMKLLENVKGAKSSPRTVATAMAFGKKLKKITCLVGNCPGFIANRVMGRSGADKVLHSGALPHEVDAAAEAFGMRMGPFRMADLVGIDLFGRERAKSGQADPKTNVRDALYAVGRYGQKTGKGFYKYDAQRKLSRCPEAEEIIAGVWRSHGVSHRQMSQEEIVQQLYFPVINEGFKCLEEGIAIRPSDIDVCMVFGYSWPRYRGGPMQYASAVGLPKVLAALEQMGVQPSELLKECVRNGWTLESGALRKRIAQLSKL